MKIKVTLILLLVIISSLGVIIYLIDYNNHELLINTYKKQIYSNNDTNLRRLKYLENTDLFNKLQDFQISSPSWLLINKTSLVFYILKVKADPGYRNIQYKSYFGNYTNHTGKFTENSINKIIKEGSNQSNIDFKFNMHGEPYVTYTNNSNLLNNINSSSGWICYQIFHYKEQSSISGGPRITIDQLSIVDKTIQLSFLIISIPV